jgi:hypothetical protein
LERLRRAGAAGGRSGKERAAGGREVDPVAAGGGGERSCRERGGHGDARDRHREREAGTVAAACGGRSVEWMDRGGGFGRWGSAQAWLPIGRDRMRLLSCPASMLAAGCLLTLLGHIFFRNTNRYRYYEYMYIHPTFMNISERLS